MNARAEVVAITGASAGITRTAVRNQRSRELANALNQIVFAGKLLDLLHDGAADNSCVGKTPHRADLLWT